MTLHRFTNLLSAPEATNRLALSEAFVPCPVFQAFSPAQQTQIQEVYRVAAAMTREQMQPVRYPEFSVN